MTNKITYGQVDRWHYQIQRMLQTGDVLALFHSKDIEVFFDRFDYVLKAIEEKSHEFNEQYIAKDDLGAYLTEIVDGRKQLVFKSEEAKKEYQDKYKCWANSPIPPKPNIVIAK